MESIAVIGVGRLGICTALTLEAAGYSVDCYDTYKPTLESVRNKTIESYEPGVSDTLKTSKNLHAKDTMRDIMHNKIFFCVVATPSLSDGEYNHQHLDAVVDEMIKYLPEYPGKKILNVCCTTMPGHCDFLQEKFKGFDVDVCYNPEFIAQGDILRGFSRPDIVLIGEANKEAGDALVEIYKKFIKSNPVYCRMSRTEAEITKISINCFVTTKISFANTIGDLCVKRGLPTERVLHAIGSDSRVGTKYLRWGHGYGGPCFPRDNRALCFFAAGEGIKNIIGEATDATNKKHLDFLVNQLISLKNKTKKEFLFTNLAYKPGTVILEESQSLQLALALKEQGHTIYVDEAKDLIPILKNTYTDTFSFVENYNRDDYLVVDDSLSCLSMRI